MNATDKKGVAMANEPGGAMRGVTRREAVTLGLAGATALALGGICGQAWAAGAGGSEAAATSQAQGSGKGTKAASAQGAAGKAAAGSAHADDATAAGGTATKSGSTTGDSGASSKGASTGSSADNTSTKSNKARKFKEIPEDALISVDDLYELFDAGKLKSREVCVIDIRSHRDFQNQLIEGSRNIPAGRQIEIRMSEIPQDKEVILVALKNSNRLAETWFTLIANGYDEELVKVLDGGVKAWADAGYPTLEDQFLGC